MSVGEGRLYPKLSPAEPLFIALPTRSFEEDDDKMIGLLSISRACSSGG
jgi:hypothetical protein